MTTVAITGASGYLGGLLVNSFRNSGAEVRRFVRSPMSHDDQPFTLGDEIPASILSGVHVLIHAAYDMKLISADDVWAVNVGGTRHLLRAANEAGVDRIIVLSSMSAYEGTRQLYGRAKLAIESDAARAGSVILRPGLVVGKGAGGMSGSLGKLNRMGIAMSVGGAGPQFAISADVFASAVVRLATTACPPIGVPLGLAAADPIPFDDRLRSIARMNGSPVPSLIRVPWQVVLGILRFGEALRVPLPFRSDSLLGLVTPAPCVPGRKELATAGITVPHPFSVTAGVASHAIASTQS